MTHRRPAVPVPGEHAVLGFSVTIMLDFPCLASVGQKGGADAKP
jgi:hypothetical protein